MEKNNTGQRPKVAILTSLVDYSPGYSLSGIILDQARILKAYGYDFDLLCLKSFNRKAPESVAVEEEDLHAKYILPQTRLIDIQPTDKPVPDGQDDKGKPIQGFETQVDIHFHGDPNLGTIGYKDALKDYDVVIDHDLMFLSWHLPQNAALRRCMDLWPEKNWLHWVHSGPSHPPAGMCYPSELRFTAAPHSTYVYLNHSQANEYALMIQSARQVVRTVYNPKDIRDVWNFGELSRDMIKRYDLLDHQILQVYPFSTPRWKDKGIPQLLRLFGWWKKWKIKAKLVLITAHCNNKIDDQYINAIEATVKAEGLILDEDVILSCRYADELEDKAAGKALRYTVPFQAVKELGAISNMFIFPSVSECCSLIQAEASMAGKFMVLNRDFWPMLEFCVEGVMNYEFTKNTVEQRAAYYECVAREIWANFTADTTIQNRTKAITQTYNADHIFRTQLEPILYLKSTQPKIPASPAPVEVLRPEFRNPNQEPVSGPDPESEVVETGVVLEGPSGQKIPMKLQEIVQRKKLETNPQPIPVKAIKEDVDVEAEEEVLVSKDEPVEEAVDFENPFDGMSCPIYGSCSQDRREVCLEQAGHCLMLDQDLKKETASVE